jgi:hypothetical protein
MVHLACINYSTITFSHFWRVFKEEDEEEGMNYLNNGTNLHGEEDIPTGDNTRHKRILETFAIGLEKICSNIDFCIILHKLSGACWGGG